MLLDNSLFAPPDQGRTADPTARLDVLTAVVTIDGREQILSENQSTYIPLGVTHRLYNPGKVALELIEVQSGAYLGEDDIVRLEDAYGRTPEKPADDDGAANQAA